MQPIDYTVLVSLGALLIAVMAFFWRLQTQHRSLERVVQQMQVKVSTLWEIYGVDAIRAAQQAGFAAHSSQWAVTDRWSQVMPPGPRQRITECLKARLRRMAPEDAAIEVYQQEREALQRTAEEHSVPASVLYAVLRLLAEQIKEAGQ